MRNPIMRRAARLVVAAVALSAAAVAAVACSSSDTTPQTPAQLGEALVAANGCGACHQSPNASDGILSGQTTPAPGVRVVAYGPNLTPDIETGIGSWSDAQIERALLTGKDDDDATLCSAMPIFADGCHQASSACGASDTDTCCYPALGADDIQDIIAYLRGIPAVHREIPESPCAPPGD